MRGRQEEVRLGVAEGTCWAGVAGSEGAEEGVGVAGGGPRRGVAARVEEGRKGTGIRAGVA